MSRVRLEAVLASVFAVLTIVTLIWPTWIESLSGLEPDGGNGESEWWIVAVFAALTVVAAALAGRDYRALARRTASDAP